MASDGGMRAVTRLCNYQQIKTAQLFLTYNEEPRDGLPVKVIVCYGGTGTGKTHWVNEQIGERSNDAYWHPGGKWWDGYDGHDIVVFDDFRGSWWALWYMLKICQRFPMQVEVKGGMRQLTAHTIYITSNRAPDHWYNVNNDNSAQLLRRIHTTHHMTETYVAPMDVVPEVGVPEVGGNNRPPLLVRTQSVMYTPHSVPEAWVDDWRADMAGWGETSQEREFSLPKDSQATVAYEPTPIVID